MTSQSIILLVDVVLWVLVLGGLCHRPIRGDLLKAMGIASIVVIVILVLSLLLRQFYFLLPIATLSEFLSIDARNRVINRGECENFIFYIYQIQHGVIGSLPLFAIIIWGAFSKIKIIRYSAFFFVLLFAVFVSFLIHVFHSFE